ncbi:MAG: hypothetical protein HXX10_26260 [Rhodoplanes sp.]|uniref:hypothetical protein n=1 Tax=Rhodoplanes sp. TaxID=1968906 RepID=UPI001823082D|nr:hypothetical protein [Rhodoplanes sp.]NVO17547.1 hypothetical protein [Rhodoplanes sp.]
MSTPDETMPTATCGVCDDVLIHVPTPCAVDPRGPAAALFVCAACGTRQTHPRRRHGDYFGVVMRVRPTRRRAHALRMAAR